MQHSEETAAAIAKAIQDCNEGWQKRFADAMKDMQLRQRCIEKCVGFPDPVNMARDMYKFIVEPFVIKDDA